MLKKILFLSFILVNSCNSIKSAEAAKEAHSEKKSEGGKKYTLIDVKTLDRFNDEYVEDKFSDNDFNNDLYDNTLATGDRINGENVQSRYNFCSRNIIITRNRKKIADYTILSTMDDSVILSDELVAWRSESKLKVCISDLYTGKIVQEITFKAEIKKIKKISDTTSFGDHLAIRLENDEVHIFKR